MFWEMALNVRFVPADKGLFRWVDWGLITQKIGCSNTSDKQSDCGQHLKRSPQRNCYLLNWFANKPESISIGATHSMR
jgi:hypothetical protein